MTDGKGPSGWERGLHAGIICPVCLHSPRLQPAAHPADLAAAHCRWRGLPREMGMATEPTV